VVRITSDDPLIDPQLIDLHVEHMRARWQHVDFVTNMARQTFPFGLAVEAMPMDTLARCHRLSTSAFLREHVTTLVYERPDLFLIEHVLNDTDLSGLRWTVDTIEDFRFVLSVYEAFGHDRFSWRDALAATRETVAACGTSVAGHVRQPECG
jgi:spore coat polysaccharide biosynthesis protein SpsF